MIAMLRIFRRKGAGDQRIGRPPVPSAAWRGGATHLCGMEVVIMSVQRLVNFRKVVCSTALLLGAATPALAVDDVQDLRRLIEEQGRQIEQLKQQIRQGEQPAASAPGGKVDDQAVKKI